jgi:hypothetical protein
MHGVVNRPTIDGKDGVAGSIPAGGSTQVLTSANAGRSPCSGPVVGLESTSLSGCGLAVAVPGSEPTLSDQALLLSAAFALWCASCTAVGEHIPASESESGTGPPQTRPGASHDQGTRRTDNPATYMERDSTSWAGVAFGRWHQPPRPGWRSGPCYARSCAACRRPIAEPSSVPASPDARRSQPALERVNPPRWWALTDSGTSDPAICLIISRAVSLGLP